MPQPPGGPFDQACVLLHADVLYLLVRVNANAEFDAFALAADHPVEIGNGETPKLVLRTTAGDRHAVVATAEQVAVLEDLVARLPSPPAGDTDGQEADGQEDEQDAQQDQQQQEESPGEPSSVELAATSSSDATPADPSESEIQATTEPTSGAGSRDDAQLQLVAEVLLAGELTQAAEMLANLAEAPEGAPFSELRRVVLALEASALGASGTGDVQNELDALQASAYTFFELRRHKTALDGVVAQLLAPALEDAELGALAARAWLEVEGRQAAVERARLLRALDADEEELDEEYSASAAAFLRRYLAHHTDDAVARQRLGLHLEGQGELQAAIQELERAVELDATNFGALYALVRVLEELGQPDAAATQRQRLVEGFTVSADLSSALIGGVAISALQLGQMARAEALVAELGRRAQSSDQAGHDANLTIEAEELGEVCDLVRDERYAEAALCALMWWEQPPATAEPLCQLLAERLVERQPVIATALLAQVEGGRERHPALFREHGDIADLEKRAYELISQQLEDGLDADSEGQLTVSALRYRAIASFARFEPEQAAEYARRAVALDTADLRSQLTLLRILEDRLVEEREAIGDHSDESIAPSPELLTCISAGLALSPQHPRFLRALANYGEDATSALTASQTLLARDPTDQQALSACAARLRQLGQLEALAEHVAYMLSLDTDDLETIGRARQALVEEAERQRSGDRPMSVWMKVAIVAGLAAALILLLLKSIGSS